MDLVPEEKFSRIIRHECQVGRYDKLDIAIPSKPSEVVKFASRMRMMEEVASQEAGPP